MLNSHLVTRRSAISSRVRNWNLRFIPFPRKRRKVERALATILREGEQMHNRIWEATGQLGARCLCVCVAVV